MSDPVHDIIRALKPLFTTHPDPRTPLSKLRTIFGGDATAEIFAYLCLHGAATSWTLQSELNIPEPTVHGAIKRLNAIGVLRPALRTLKPKHSRGGPRPTIWLLELDYVAPEDREVNR